MQLNNYPCLVVGGGPVALRKIRLQLDAGAKITVIAPQICAQLEAEFGTKITHLAREFDDVDIAGFRLITAATNNPAVNARVSRLAMAANVPVNVVDQPELCSFITPAIVDREPITVAISTGGAAPVLARQIRGQIEAMLSPGLGALAAAMRNIRSQVGRVFSDENQRRQWWEQLLNSSVVEHYAAGRESAGKAALEKLLESAQPHKPRGEVSLVGAGPGDPDLLTFKALRLMQRADVVLYDRLVSEAVLNLTRRDADRIYVGKQRDKHTVPQGDINKLLLQLAQEGKKVVRLKGGDPFIFGRGGEELELLSAAGIPFQIVPGVTAASGCATYAGIPLTHRDHAQSCLFVTGHRKDGAVDLDWQRLTATQQTVVIYMGLVGLPIICEKLIEHGLPTNTPIALIEQGTTQNQRVFTGTLNCLPQRVAEQDIHAPTLIIIGSVVSLQPKLAWFNTDSV